MALLQNFSAVRHIDTFKSLLNFEKKLGLHFFLWILETQACWYFTEG